MKECGVINEYFLANNYSHKVNDGNTNTRPKPTIKPTIKTTERQL